VHVHRPVEFVCTGSRPATERAKPVDVVAHHTVVCAVGHKDRGRTNRYALRLRKLVAIASAPLAARDEEPARRAGRPLHHSVVRVRDKNIPPAVNRNAQGRIELV
jgi:hypothetical protein